MNPLDDFIERVTRRLKPDGELAAEVGHELRTHIEDAEAEARASGMSEDEAMAHALKRLGDADQLADQLWKANRRRMNLRNVGKWAFRLVAMPAALLLALLLLWDGLDLPAYLKAVDIYGGTRDSWLAKTKIQSPSPRPGLTAKDTAFLAVRDLPRDSRAEAWTKLAPHDPMFVADRLNVLLGKINQESNPAPALFEQAVKVADEGEKLDPNNAFFNYIKACLLFRLSGAEYGGHNYLTYTHYSSKGKPVEQYVYRVEYKDRTLFQEGIEEFRKGAAKPYCETYATKIARFMANLEAPPRSLLDELYQIFHGADFGYVVILKHLPYWVMGEVVNLTEADKISEAESLMALAPVPGTQLGQQGNTVIEVIVARSMRIYPLEASAELLRKWESPNCEIADAVASEDNLAYWEACNFAEAAEKDAARRAGIIGRTFFAFGGLEDHTLFTPMRNAERAVFERAAVGFVALLFTAQIALLAGTLWLGRRRGRTGTGGPTLFFIGWRRLAYVIALGVLVPVCGYLLFTGSSLGSAQYSMNYAARQATLELAGAGVLIILAVNVMGFIFIRALARDRGLPLPRIQWGKYALIWVLAILAIGLAWLVMIPLFDSDLADRGVVAAILLGLIAVLGILILIIGHFINRAEAKTPGAAAWRPALLPILAAALLVLGLLTRFPLKSIEANAVAQLNATGRSPFLNELEFSKFKDYRAYLQSLPDNGRLELKDADASPGK